MNPLLPRRRSMAACLKLAWDTEDDDFGSARDSGCLIRLGVLHPLIRSVRRARPHLGVELLHPLAIWMLRWGTRRHSIHLRVKRTTCHSAWTMSSPAKMNSGACGPTTLKKRCQPRRRQLQRRPPHAPRRWRHPACLKRTISAISPTRSRPKRAGINPQSLMLLAGIVVLIVLNAVSFALLL